jgi:hypothetical protein
LLYKYTFLFLYFLNGQLLLVIFHFCQIHIFKLVLWNDFLLLFKQLTKIIYMKKFTKGKLAFLAAAIISLSSCGGPNDDEGGQDHNNSGGEGEIDSSRLIMSDSAGARATVPYFVKPNHSFNKKQGS